MFGGVHETVDLQVGLGKKRVTTRWRLAVFALCETVDQQVALGKKRVTTRWRTDHRKGRNQSTIRRKRIARGNEAMYDAVALSSTPSTGRIIDYLSLKNSYHTFTADVTNAYFHVDDDEEIYVDPPAEWLEQQAALGNPTSVLMETAKTAVRTATRWKHAA